MLCEGSGTRSILCHLCHKPPGWAAGGVGSAGAGDTCGFAAIPMGLDPSLPSRPRAQSHDTNPTAPGWTHQPLHLFSPGCCTLRSMASLISYSRSHILPYLMKRKINRREKKKKKDLGKVNKDKREIRIVLALSLIGKNCSRQVFLDMFFPVKAAFYNVFIKML